MAEDGFTPGFFFGGFMMLFIFIVFISVNPSGSVKQKEFRDCRKAANIETCARVLGLEPVREAADGPTSR